MHRIACDLGGGLRDEALHERDRQALIRGVVFDIPYCPVEHEAHARERYFHIGEHLFDLLELADMLAERDTLPCMCDRIFHRSLRHAH